MEKVGVSKLVEFRRIEKQDPKLTFVKNLQKPKAENSGNGGDYWISCTSACAATFWNKDKVYLHDKIHELKEKIQATNHKGTKDQFQKNIDILFAMQEFDFESILPQAELKKESLKQNIIPVYNLPVQVRPQYVFSYKIDENPHIAGVWFVAKKGGFKKGELGMFVIALHQYLTKRFSDKFAIDPEYCVAVDVSTLEKVRYLEILKGKIPNLLQTTIFDLKKLL